MSYTEGAEPIDNTADIIDSRDIIARIAYLRDLWAETTGDDPGDYSLSGDDWLTGLSEDERDELVTLLELAEEGETLADWQHGETLIRDSYFEEYARELAEDIGAVASDAAWPAYCIDWQRAARELQADYTSLDFDGVTYWARS